MGYQTLTLTPSHLSVNTNSAGVITHPAGVLARVTSTLSGSDYSVSANWFLQQSIFDPFLNVYPSSVYVSWKLTSGTNPITPTSGTLFFNTEVVIDTHPDVDNVAPYFQQGFDLSLDGVWAATPSSLATGTRTHTWNAGDAFDVGGSTGDWQLYVYLDKSAQSFTLDVVEVTFTFPLEADPFWTNKRGTFEIL